MWHRYARLMHEFPHALPLRQILQHGAALDASAEHTGPTTGADGAAKSNAPVTTNAVASQRPRCRSRLTEPGLYVADAQLSSPHVYSRGGASTGILE